MNRAGKPLAALLLATLSLIAVPAPAADTATVARDTDLREKPLNDATVVGRLKAKSTVSVQARTGAWAKVEAGDGKAGYVRLLNLRTSSGQHGDSGISSVASAFRTGSSGESVSTGVKGMSEEDLTGAKPAPEEAKKLDGYKADAKDARDGARVAGLAAAQVDYLPAPAGKNK